MGAGGHQVAKTETALSEIYTTAMRLPFKFCCVCEIICLVWFDETIYAICHIMLSK